MAVGGALVAHRARQQVEAARDRAEAARHLAAELDEAARQADGTNDIGVWAPAVALREVRYAGRYHQTGDRVRVSGLFRRADPEFGGDLVIRANSVEVVARGGLAQHTIPAGRPLVTLGALVIAAALGALRWKARATS